MQNEKKTDIRELNLSDLTGYMEEIGEKKFRAKQIFDWLWKMNVAGIDDMSNLSKDLREHLKTTFTVSNLKPIAKQKSNDGTIKTAFELFDGKNIESVLIPSKDRVTACISTQAGCAVGCKFCATGKLKFKRHLSAAEIFQQVHYTRKLSENDLKTPLTNIVVMGMGEPLLNYENTMLALKYVSDEEILGMSPRRITLSTSGIAPKIVQLADDGAQFNLAISLHTANDKKRDHLMPINKKYPLEELSKAIEYYHNKTENRLTFEYLMLRNFNDSLEDAKELARFCKVVPCKINLIEYNKVEGTEFEKSSADKLRAFADFLESKNMIINIRHSKGEDIDAACGQLANKLKNTPLPVVE